MINLNHPIWIGISGAMFMAALIMFAAMLFDVLRQLRKTPDCFGVECPTCGLVWYRSDSDCPSCKT